MKKEKRLKLAEIMRNTTSVKHFPLVRGWVEGGGGVVIRRHQFSIRIEITQVCPWLSTWQFPHLTPNLLWII